jgi:hypothetical protein
MEAQFGALAFAIFVAAQFVAVIAAHGARPKDPSGLVSLARPVEPSERPWRAGRARRAVVVTAPQLP